MDLIALENKELSLVPLKADDYQRLFSVASSKEIWEQHPNQNRYLPTEFQLYFDQLLNCDIAYLVTDRRSNSIIGATAFYNLDREKKQVAIGYTFLTTKYWGTGINTSLKSLMINYAFQFVDHIMFYVGAHNIRSQKAVQKLGARKTGELLKQTKPHRHNYEYTLSKDSI